MSPACMITELILFFILWLNAFPPKMASPCNTHPKLSLHAAPLMSQNTVMMILTPQIVTNHKNYLQSTWDLWVISRVPINFSTSILVVTAYPIPPQIIWWVEASGWKDWIPYNIWFCNRHGDSFGDCDYTNNDDDQTPEVLPINLTGLHRTDNKRQQ